ncbi:MAG TPA: glycosyltransferase family 9 protein [Salinivirgaceae bacterium]|nr:glycosyltransferase family 9 protein [Salinivirgaceae bacterium]
MAYREKKILIVQTAFIGDAILATAMVEKLANAISCVSIDILVRKGNEEIFKYNPHISTILTWNKKQNKYRELIHLLKIIRKNRYDIIINLQRFFSTGNLTAFSRAKMKIGFSKNPWSFCFHYAYKHRFDGGHEVDRNQQLIAFLTDSKAAKPKIYIPPKAFESVAQYKKAPYVCIAPASVWFTKQFPKKKWIEFVDCLPPHYKVYLLGSSSDSDLCTDIVKNTKNQGVENLAGKLSLLESAALMCEAEMNYVNDSAPLHLCSATNAPVTAIFCSTIPEFGFGPLSDVSYIIQTEQKLACRPCGLHGKKQCPEGHFNCAESIEVKALLNTLNQSIIR